MSLTKIIRTHKNKYR